MSDWHIHQTYQTVRFLIGNAYFGTPVLYVSLYCLKYSDRVKLKFLSLEVGEPDLS